MTKKKTLTVDAIATHVQEAWTDFKGNAKRALEDSIRLGDKLAQAKRRLDHGAWTPWLEANVPDMTPRHARRFMKLAANKPAIKDGKFQNMEQALASLAAPVAAEKPAAASVAKDTPKPAKKRDAKRGDATLKNVTPDVEAAVIAGKVGPTLPGMDAVATLEHDAVKAERDQALAKCGELHDVIDGTVVKTGGVVAEIIKDVKNFGPAQAEAALAEAVMDACDEACEPEPLEATPFRTWLAAALAIPVTEATNMTVEDFWTTIGCDTNGKRGRFREVVRELPDVELVEDKKADHARLDRVVQQQARIDWKARWSKCVGLS